MKVRVASEFEDISRNVAIECGERRYVMALDNGKFTLGPTRNEGTMHRRNEHSDDSLTWSQIVRKSR